MKRMIAIGLFAVAGFIAAKNAAAQTPSLSIPSRDFSRSHPRTRLFGY